MSLLPSLQHSLLLQDEGASATEFTFLGGPPLWVTILVLLPAIFFGVHLIYRREAPSASRNAKRWLAMLRIVVLVVVMFMLFQPVNRSQVFSVTRSIVAVLLDESASMDRREDYSDELSSKLAAAAYLPSGTGAEEVPRSQLVKQVLGGGETSLLQQLKDKADIELYGFSSTPRSLTEVGELASTGEATALGDAMLHALNELRHKNLSAVVVVTDGQSNRGRDPLEVARLAASEAIPIHTVGVGNPSLPKNLAILEVVAPDVALAHDEVAVEVLLASVGYEGDSSELIIRDRETGDELAQSSFSISGGDQQTETVYFKPTREGEYTLEVSLPVKSDEQFSDDNMRTHHLRVEPEVIKVLYVEGRPRWEYRFLKSLLLRAENLRFQMLAVWTSDDVIQDSTEGVQPLIAFPPTSKDLFEYDVIILGDVAPEEIDKAGSRGTTNDLLAELRQFVEIGGGLIMLAGQLDSPRSYRDTPVEDILPVEIGNSEESQAEVQDRRPFRPHIPDPLQPHNIIRLEKDVPMNFQLWEDPDVGLPHLRWYAPVRRAKPGAEVILEHPTNSNRYGPHVLVAATQHGEGRTVFIGVDESWLWRKPYENRYTERFWRSAIRHVAIGKLRRANKRFDLRTDKDRYNLGELIQLSVRVLNENFEESTEDTHVIRMQWGEREVEDLLVYRQEQGTYERTVRADRPQTVRFWVEDASQGDKKLSLKTVEVQVPRLEILKPSLDAAGLAHVASLAGGRTFGLHEFDELVDSLQGQSRRIPIRTEQQDLWDRWELLALILALLTTEWAVRKRYNLL